jgi:hypothetical protein
MDNRLLMSMARFDAPTVALTTLSSAHFLALSCHGGQGETLVPPTAVAGGDEGFVFEFEASDNNNSG